MPRCPRKHAAEALRLTARDLAKLNLINEVISEPMGGAHRRPDKAAANLEKFLISSLNDLRRLNVDTLVKRRHERIRQLGSFFEAPDEPKSASAKETATTRRSVSRTARLRGRFSRAGKVAR